MVPLQDVQEGEVVGRVVNSWEYLLETLTAPVTGRVLSVRTDPPL